MSLSIAIECTPKRLHLSPPTLQGGMSARNSVLAVYREALRTITRLPNEAQRAAAAQEARDSMRAHMDAGPEQAADLMRVLVSKISYMRMIVPKQPRDKGKVGTGTFVVRDGAVVPGQGESMGARYVLSSGAFAKDGQLVLHRIVPAPCACLWPSCGAPGPVSSIALCSPSCSCWCTQNAMRSRLRP